MHWSSHLFGQTHQRRACQRSAFTLPEVLVVGGIIAVLIAIVLPALSGGLRTAQLAKSQSNLKQIFTWMTAYSGENREHIVPSQFDYTAAAAISPVKVRSLVNPPVGNQYQGTWTDILWTFSGQKVVDSADPDRYLYDSPDSAYYSRHTDDDSNVFRSARPNTRNALNGNQPTPFGQGAMDIGQPGYFAANNFFNADSGSPTFNGWWTTGQIRAPERSMYLVDSLAGETIEDEQVVGGDDPWDNYALSPVPAVAGLPNPCQVDFRYTSSCLMLFLDGHSEAQYAFLELDELQNGRKIKIENLHQN